METAQHDERKTSFAPKGWQEFILRACQLIKPCRLLRERALEDDPTPLKFEALGMHRDFPRRIAQTSRF